MVIEREIRYQEQRRKIDLQPFLHKRAGEFQDAIFQKVGMMIYGMERCEIVGTNHQTIILGESEESSYSAKLGKILENFGITTPEEMSYIELFDRSRDENGNVIKENRRIDDYNQYLVNKSADEYDRYFDDMIEHQSSQMYSGIDTVLQRVVSGETYAQSVQTPVPSLVTESPMAVIQHLLEELNQGLDEQDDDLHCNSVDPSDPNRVEELIDQQESILNLVNTISQNSLHNTFLNQSMVRILSTAIADPNLEGGPFMGDVSANIPLPNRGARNDDFRCNSVHLASLDPSGANRVDDSLQPSADLRSAKKVENLEDGERPPAPEPTENPEEEQVYEEQVYEEQVYENDGNLEPMPTSLSNPFQPTILESRLLNAILNPFNELPALTRSTSITTGSPLSSNVPSSIVPSSIVPSFFPMRFYTFNSVGSIFRSSTELQGVVNIPTTYNSESFVSQLGQQIRQQMEDIKVTLTDAEYEEIPTKPFGECSTEEQEAQPICIICSDNFTKEDQVKITKCHHIIHDRCLRPWLLKESKKCPVCRCELAKGVAHLSGQEEPDSDDDDEEEEEEEETKEDHS